MDVIKTFCKQRGHTLDELINPITAKASSDRDALINQMGHIWGLRKRDIKAYLDVPIEYIEGVLRR